MALVVDLADFAAKSEAKALGLSVEKVAFADVSGAIDRFIVGRVGPGAFILLRIILGMTLGRGRQSAAIRYVEFKEGVYIEGKLVQAGTGMSEVSIAKHIEELTKLGIVQVTKVRNKTQYPYSMYAIDCKNLEKLAMLNVSKKRKIPQNSTTENVVGLPLQKMKCTNTHNNKMELPKGNRRDSRARSPDTISSTVEMVKTTTQQKRGAKAATQAARQSSLTMAGVKAMWQQAVATHYPSVPAVGFSAKEFAVFKNKVKPVVQSKGLAHFFDWLAASWQDIRHARFAWLRAQNKDLSAAPSLYELMRYWKIFVTAYAESLAGGVISTRKLQRVEVDDVVDELSGTKSELAATREELRRTRERLVRAERIAYAPEPRTRTRGGGQSLTSRRTSVEQNTADTGEIPKWKS